MKARVYGSTNASRHGASASRLALTAALSGLTLVLLGLYAAPAAAADEVRDPMRPPRPAPSAAAPAREALPVLTAIIGTAGDRVAVINDQLVRSGGSVDGYVIEQVFETGVRYRRAGVTHDLYLPHMAAFKKPATALSNKPKEVH
jgi:hypothetical protein